jgi:predicted metal-dependent hydrolase
MNRLAGPDLLKDDVKVLLCRKGHHPQVHRHVETMTTAEAILTSKVLAKVIAKVIAHLGHSKILH